jgi:hypothetical protein
LRFRLLNLLAGLMLVVFNALVGVWPMVAMNLATSAINVWFIRAVQGIRWPRRRGGQRWGTDTCPHRFRRVNDLRGGGADTDESIRESVPRATGSTGPRPRVVSG